jgi:flagellar FliL protein
MEQSKACRRHRNPSCNFYPLEFNVRNLLAVLLLCSVFFSAARAEEHGGKEGDGAGPQYVPMEPVIVNLDGRRHYLRANIQLLVDSAEHAEKIKHHMPAIRDALITLFSGRDPVALAAVEERENLRKSAREEIGKVLGHFKAGKGFEDIFFTDFMIQ